MDAPVIAALITAPSAFVGTVAGVLLTNRLSLRKHLDEQLNTAIAILHGDNEAAARDAYNDICTMLRFERLSKRQKARVVTSSGTYLARPKPSSVVESAPAGGLTPYA